MKHMQNRVGREYSVSHGVNFAVEQIKVLQQQKHGIIIGIAGGSGAGKGYIAAALTNLLSITILVLDDYYRGQSRMRDQNYDHPDALDLPLLSEHLGDLRAGKSIHKPVYDFTIHERTGFVVLHSSAVLILEGLHALHHTLKPFIDLGIFVDASEKVRFQRRLTRDTNERGRSEQSVLQQWNETVVPMHKTFVMKQKNVSDLIILNN
ncbi:uridine kinase [candidate division CSSED10-310 bacterium]|uniref:Uridine kinase n=1 Tax=candidate division CSSED10-310 bacterium TaxID=2855610 RepID=A0ABV6Z1D6_UNCC1